MAPTRRKVISTPGPASGTVTAITKKMPVPIVAPTPIIISENMLSERSRRT